MVKDGRTRVLSAEIRHAGQAVPTRFGLLLDGSVRRQIIRPDPGRHHRRHHDDRRALDNLGRWLDDVSTKI